MQEVDREGDDDEDGREEAMKAARDPEERGFPAMVGVPRCRWALSRSLGDVTKRYVCVVTDEAFDRRDDAI